MATTPRKTAAKTTAAKKSTAKTTAAQKPAIKRSPTAAKAPVVTPSVVASASAVVAPPELKKKELVDRVVARSGVKKKDAKPAVEAALAVLGEALANGEELNLQPFGKLKINREKVAGNHRIIVCKLRQNINPVVSNSVPTAAE